MTHHAKKKLSLLQLLSSISQLKKLNTLLIYAMNTLKSCISVYKHIHLPHLLPKLFHPPFSRTTQWLCFIYLHRFLTSHLHVPKTSTSLINFKSRLKVRLVSQDSPQFPLLEYFLLNHASGKSIHAHPFTHTVHLLIIYFLGNFVAFKR